MLANTEIKSLEETIQAIEVVKKKTDTPAQFSIDLHQQLHKGSGLNLEKNYNKLELACLSVASIFDCKKALEFLLSRAKSSHWGNNNTEIIFSDLFIKVRSFNNHRVFNHFRVTSTNFCPLCI